MVIHPCAKFGMPMSKRKDGLAHTQIHGENIILILRPKVKIIQRSWMYVTHRPMVIHSCAKLGMTISKYKKAAPWTWSHVFFSNQSAPSGVDGNSKGPSSGFVSSYLWVRTLIFRSLRTVRLQVSFGRSLFHFPCGV